jgi:hypothetical protein
MDATYADDVICTAPAMPGWRAVFKRDGKIVDKEIVFWVVVRRPVGGSVPPKAQTEGIVLISDVAFARAPDQAGFLGYAVPGEGLTRFQHALKGEAS